MVSDLCLDMLEMDPRGMPDTASTLKYAGKLLRPLKPRDLRTRGKRGRKESGYTQNSHDDTSRGNATSLEAQEEAKRLGAMEITGELDSSVEVLGELDNDI